MAPETPQTEEKPYTNWEEILYNFRRPIIFLLIGVSLLGLGFLLQKEKKTSENIEILQNDDVKKENFFIAEISGAVENAGVYKLDEGARVEDLIIASGGISADADRNWMEKYLNRAAEVSDGQKIYIPKEGEGNKGDTQQSNSQTDKNVMGYQTVSSDFSENYGNLININTASQKELESLYGIGPVYAQKIIEQRPYSNTEELSSKSVIPKSTYEKIKDKISVY